MLFGIAQGLLLLAILIYFQVVGSSYKIVGFILAFTRQCPPFRMYFILIQYMHFNFRKKSICITSTSLNQGFSEFEGSDVLFFLP